MFARKKPGTNRDTGKETVEVLTLAGLPLDCRLVRSRRKSLAVHVRHDQIEVRAPLFVSQQDILRFLDKHRDWVTRKVSEKQQRQTEQLDLHDGGRIFYQARSLSIELCEAPRASVEVLPPTQPQRMRISGPGIALAPQERAAAILKNWLQAMARSYLPARTHALAAHLGVDHKLKDVVFRKTRSKWGHCTAAGRIQYNWLIMLAPDGVIDYMICHEVCHLLHMNHSPGYWKAVASVCPDYKRYVGWLKQHEHRLWF